jgi:hypothetical protein
MGWPMRDGALAKTTIITLLDQQLRLPSVAGCNRLTASPRVFCDDARSRAVKAAAESEYAEFVTHHADRLCRAAYLLCGDWARAEDATQEALLKLYRSWSRLRNRGSIATYSRKVLVSATIDGLRRRSSREITGGAR